MTLPKRHPNQQRVVNEAVRFNVLVNGRRWGKTMLGEDRAVHPMLEGQPVGWFSPTYKLLKPAWRELKKMLAPVTLDKSEQEHRIEILTGGVLEMWTMEDVDAGRGRKYRRVIVDEAAVAKDLETSWENAIRQTLTDLAGDAWFMSTPKPRNFYRTLFDRGNNREKWPAWRSWQMPTSTNPYIPPWEIEAARQELTDRAFRQEYLAEFLEGEGMVFRNIQACLKAPLVTKPSQHSGHRVVIGLDWGRHEDYTSASCFCVDCRKEVQRDRFSQIDYAVQRGRVKALAERWKASVLGELNAMGEPNVEALRAEGVNVTGFLTTATSKPPLIQSLVLAFEREEAQWQDDPVWTAELEAYTMDTNPVTGRPKYEAAKGHHDDTVMARALAWRHATTGGIGLGIA